MGEKRQPPSIADMVERGEVSFEINMRGSYVALLPAMRLPDEWPLKPMPMWRGRCAEGEFSIDIDGERIIVKLNEDGEVAASRSIPIPGNRDA